MIIIVLTIVCLMSPALMFDQCLKRAPAAEMVAAVRGEKQQDEKNIMEDQEDWQEHPWEHYQHYMMRNRETFSGAYMRTLWTIMKHHKRPRRLARTSLRRFNLILMSSKYRRGRRSCDKQTFKVMYGLKEMREEWYFNTQLISRTRLGHKFISIKFSMSQVFFF